MDIGQMQDYINSLSEQYFIIANRITKDLEGCADIQEKIVYCVELLKKKGIYVEMPSIEAPSNA